MRAFLFVSRVITAAIISVFVWIAPAAALTTTNTVGVCANFPSSISTSTVTGINIVRFVTTLVVGDVISFSGTITLEPQANNGVVARVTGSGGTTVVFTTGGPSFNSIESFSTTYTATVAGTHVFEVETEGEVSQISAMVSCTPAPVTPLTSTGIPLTTIQVTQQTVEVIEKIIKIRIPGMVTDEPDLVARLRIGGGFKPGPVSVFGFAGDQRSNVRLSTGIAQIQNNLNKASANYSQTNDSDFWVEGRFSHSTTSEQHNVLAVIYAAFDHLVNEDLLVGALGQFDYSEDWSRNSNASAQSVGWMAGPYFVYRLFDNIYLDGRAAYGTSSGELKPFGTYVDGFVTQRWLVRAQLTGDYKVRNVRISPLAQIVYFSETQNAYTDALGIGIPGQNVSLGRFTTGVEFARTWVLDNGAEFAPQLAFKGVWDFAGEGTTRVQGLASFLNDFHGRIEAGFRYTGKTGPQISLEAFYDGIGNNNFDMIGGRVRLVIPLR